MGKSNGLEHQKCPLKSTKRRVLICISSTKQSLTSWYEKLKMKGCFAIWNSKNNDNISNLIWKKHHKICGKILIF